MLKLNLVYLKKVSFVPFVKSQSEMETFIDGRKTELKCEYKASSSETDVSITNSVVIDKYEWFKDGSKFSNGSKLAIDKLNQTIHNSSYTCLITLKNGQAILSDPFKLIVYKCKEI